MSRIFWFRRDLRVNDHPALNSAISAANNESDPRVFAVVSPVDYIDSKTLEPARQESLWESWRCLNADLTDSLTVLADPIDGIIEIRAVVGGPHTRSSDSEGLCGRKCATDRVVELDACG